MAASRKGKNQTVVAATPDNEPTPESVTDPTEPIVMTAKPNRRGGVNIYSLTHGTSQAGEKNPPMVTQKYVKCRSRMSILEFAPGHVPEPTLQ